MTSNIITILFRPLWLLLVEKNVCEILFGTPFSNNAEIVIRENMLGQEEFIWAKNGISHGENCKLRWICWHLESIVIIPNCTKWLSLVSRHSKWNSFRWYCNYISHINKIHYFKFVCNLINTFEFFYITRLFYHI